MEAESLDITLAKRDSFAHMWKLLAPEPKFQDLYSICMIRWNRLSHRAQQQMYWFIREKKRRGETVYDNPLFALTYTKPFPTNWNGKCGINEMFGKTQMVSAYYNGSFGIYTRLEATIFEMTHVQQLN